MLSENDFLDEESRILFEANKKYYETNDLKWRFKGILDTHSFRIENLIRINQMINEKISAAKDGVYIFGAGVYGKNAYNAVVMHGLKVSGFIDNDERKRNHNYCALPVYEISVLDKLSDFVVLIPESPYSLQMYNQLREEGIQDIKVVYIYNSYEEILNNYDCHFFQGSIFSKKSRFIVCKSARYDYSTNLFNLIEAIGGEVDFVIDETSIEHAKSLKYYLESIPNLFIIVFSEQAREKFIRLDVEPNRVIQLFNSDGMLQYFDPLIVKHNECKEEIFVDGGALDLTVSKNAMIWSKGSLKKVYAFEPGKRQFELCISALYDENYMAEVTTIINKGLYSTSEKLLFNEKDYHLGASSIVLESCDTQLDEGIHVINTTTLDKVLDGDDVTFIKMDIEGSELEALKGSEKSIKKYHPLLAISVYHKPEDIIEIPNCIKNIDESYRFYLRAYHEDGIEMVLYGI